MATQRGPCLVDYKHVWDFFAEKHQQLMHDSDCTYLLHHDSCNVSSTPALDQTNFLVCTVTNIAPCAPMSAL